MLADYQSLVTNFVRDDAGKITPTDIDLAITGAVERYSQDRPVETAEDLVGVSGTLIALPTAWEPGFSSLISLESPIRKYPPDYLSSDSYALYLDVGGLCLMLASSLPAGSTLRAVFTVRHTLTGLIDTIPSGRREAVAKLAAASLCEQLAALYASETDSTMGADRAMGQSRSQAYAARARDYRKQYQDTVGVQERTAAPASAVVQLKSHDSLGQSRLFHPARRRPS